MPIATNAQGQAVRLDQSGQWVPTKLATNPQTKETVALDGDKWVPLGDPAKPEAAPRWDVLGDIGRAAKGAYEATKEDLSGAFPDPQKMDLGPVGTLQRMGHALRVPLDAAGIPLSVPMGVAHAIGGSALSYAIPTTGKDVTVNGQTFYGDPKKAADQIIDSAMIGLVPEDPAAFAAAAPARAAASEARTAAKVTNKAIDRVSARAKADALTPQQVLDAQKAASANGDQVTLMDVGGKNVKGLAGAVYRAPGPAGQAIDTFLKGRDEGAAGALTADVQGGVAKGSTYHTAQDLLEARSKAAGPSYKEAESVGPVHSERLQDFLDQPEVQEGLRRGIKLERLNAIAENRPFVDSEYGITGYQDGKWDVPIFDKVPTVKSLIVANEGLGAKIAEMVNPVTGRITKDGLALKKFRDAYQGEVDNLTGGKYKAARDQWSGPSQSMDALREGKEHFTRADSNEQIKAEFDQLSPGDKDFYRMGAAEAKVDAVERAPDASDKSKRVINSERDRKRFRILFDSDAQAQKFIDGVARKRQQFETKQAVKGGSQTAGRLADDANEDVPLAIEAAKTLAHAGSGNALGFANSLYRLKNGLGLRNNPALNSEIARILTDPDLSASGQNAFARVPVPKVKNHLVTPATVNALAASQRTKH